MKTRHPIPIAAAVFALPAAAAAQCEWGPLGSGPPGAGPSDEVQAFAILDGGLYAGGEFTSAGGVPGTEGVARWNGEWESMGGGVAGQVIAMAVADGALYVGGDFGNAGGVPGTNRIARWDGESWSALSNGIPERFVFAITEFDGALYVGGSFSEAGGAPGNGIARWDGESWSRLGSLGPNNFVRALTVFDDGSGPALYVAGDFTLVDGVPAGGVAKWDGVAWSAVGEGMSRTSGTMRVYTLGAFDGELYAGGDFDTAGGEYACSIARWDGAAWGRIIEGVSGPVRALQEFDDGAGSALYVGGAFARAGTCAAGGVLSWRIARWDGDAWSALDDGLGGQCVALTVFDDDLLVGGPFTEASGVPVGNIARWTCDSDCYADCDGSGGLDFFDFLCFQNLFGAGDPEADCDGSGGLDFFDFLCFQNEFAAGCS